MIWQLSSVAIASPTPTRDALKSEIDRLRSSSFEALLGHWSKDYGSEAVQPLLAIVSDRKNADRTRYVALMGAAKLGGASMATSITPYLKDSSWMIRSASLRALSALKSNEASSSVLPLLKDPALVVRVEAVDAVQELKPQGAIPALVEVLKSKENYRMGKGQWVPQRALNALVALHDPTVAPELKFLLDSKADPDLLRQTIFTLENLTGQKADHQLPLARQVEEWKKKLAALSSKK